MEFQDDISNMNTYIHTDKPKPICPPLFQSWGHKKCPERHVYPRLMSFLKYKDILKIIDLKLKPGGHSPTLALNFNV